MGLDTFRPEDSTAPRRTGNTGVVEKLLPPAVTEMKAFRKPTVNTLRITAQYPLEFVTDGLNIEALPSEQAGRGMKKSGQPGIFTIEYGW